MAKFEKGHKRPPNAGRKKGTPNKATAVIKDLLNDLLPEHVLRVMWQKNLAHKDPQIRWKAFELANGYLFGKPALPVVGSEDAPPVHIDISAIPRKRERA